MQEYCREEVVVHYLALMKLEAQETKRIAIATRAGVNADADKFENFLSMLDGKMTSKDSKFRAHLATLAEKINKGKTSSTAVQRKS